MTNLSLVTFPSREKDGSGVFNNFLNKLPFELHYSGYNYLGKKAAPYLPIQKRGRKKKILLTTKKKNQRICRSRN